MEPGPAPRLSDQAEAIAFLVRRSPDSMSNACTWCGLQWAEDDRLAGVRVVAAVDARDDVGALAGDLGVAVEVAVRAELLDEVDGHRQALAVGRVHDDVLGADTGGDLRRAGGTVDVGVDDGGAELDAAGARKVDLEQVHRGRADEPGDEDVVRLLVQVTRRADLLEQTVL